MFIAFFEISHVKELLRYLRLYESSDRSDILFERQNSFYGTGSLALFYYSFGFELQCSLTSILCILKEIERHSFVSRPIKPFTIWTK